MNSDVHPTLQGEGSYRYAEGFTLRFGQGGGMLLTPEIPTQLVALLPTGARLRGGARLPDGRLLLLLNLGDSNASPGPLHSTLAILNGSSVTTIYDDLNDPNGERLLLSDTEPAEVRVETETVTITRVYINEGTQTPYCVTLSDAPANGQSYGKLWSVHAFRLQPHVQFDPIYFYNVATGGSLPTGFYRYTYRYYRRGVVSAPFPLSTPLPLGENAATPMVQMGASGVTTATGLVFSVDSPDRRWPQIELLITYSPDGSAYTNLVVAERLDVPASGPVRLSHLRPSGTGLSVSLDDLLDSARQAHLLTAGAMAVSNHKLLFGNLQLAAHLQPPTGKVTLSPQLDSMACDDGGYPNRPANGVALASTNIDNTPLIERLFQPKAGTATATRSFPVDGLMRDYRSMQYANRRVGLRRGEQYPFAIVLFDRLGQPGFAWHLGSFNVPNYYEGVSGNTAPYAPTIQITTNGFDSYKLRLMGCNVSGIELPESLLFDKNGNLQVSGFAIVRGNASGLIRHQGVVLPSVVGINNHLTLSALPGFRNLFNDQPENGLVLLTLPELTHDNRPLAHLPGWATYHCPDLLVDGKLDEEPVSGHQLRLLGSVHGPVNGLQGTTVLRGEKDHYYVKAYGFRADNFRPDAPGRWKVGESSPIKRTFRLTTSGLGEKFYAPNEAFQFTDDVAILLRNPNGSGAGYKKGYNQPGSYLIQLTGSSLADRGVDVDNPSGYGIVNYEAPVAELNPLATTYQWTNHFQPITQAILDQLPVATDATGKRTWTVNNADVWGGDTYLCRTDMARVIPKYDDDFSSDDDYAVGLFVPIESKYNLYLRYGRRYEKVATMPQATARDGSYPEFARGINEYQPEEWSINRGLLAPPDPVRRFNAPPPDVKLEAVWPQGITWSRLKTDGELLDSYRRLPGVNLYLLEGEYGPVRGLLNLYDNLYVGQDRAFSRLPIDERQLVSTTAGEPLEAATGREVGPAQYVAREAGFSKRQHAWPSPRSIYFIDQVARKFFRFSQAGLDPISDRDGYHNQFLQEDLSYWSGHFDPIDDTVHLMNPFARLSYNEVLNCFVSTNAQAGSIWVDGLQRPVQVRATESSLSFPGRGDSSATLAFVVNPAPAYSKTFHAAVITCSEPMAKAIDRIEIKGDDTPGDVIQKAQMRYRSGRLYLPLRSANQSLPQRGKTLLVTIYWKGLLDAADNWLLSVDTNYSLNLRP